MGNMTVSQKSVMHELLTIISKTSDFTPVIVLTLTSEQRQISLCSLIHTITQWWQLPTLQNQMSRRTVALRLKKKLKRSSKSTAALTHDSSNIRKKLVFLLILILNDQSKLNYLVLFIFVSNLDFKVGRGSFKTVFKGLDSNTGSAVAWLELQPHKISKEDRERFKVLFKLSLFYIIVLFIDYSFIVYNYRPLKIIFNSARGVNSQKIETCKYRSIF